MIQSKLKQVALQADQAVIRSPFDGIVTEGSLRDRVGEVLTVGTPLLSIASRSALELKILVPEAVAPVVAAGQTGRFISQAKPEEPHPFRVRHVQSSAKVVAVYPRMQSPLSLTITRIGCNSA